MHTIGKIMYENEATARNFVVFSECHTIPSYALWSEDDIEKQTQSERLTWWKSVKQTFIHSSEVQNIAEFYIASLEMEEFKLLELTSVTKDGDPKTGTTNTE